jgi:hypothetical protein
MYLRTLKALQDLQKAAPEQAGHPLAPPPEPSSPPVGEKPGRPLVGDKPSSPPAGDKPWSPLVGDKPWSPPAGYKRQPPRKAQPLMPPIGSVPSLTHPLAGRPRGRHENHESSLQTERPAPAEHAPGRDTIDKDRSSCPQRTFQAVPILSHIRVESDRPRSAT